MGPGYMPVLLSVGLVVLGGIIALRGVTVKGPPIDRGPLVPERLDPRRRHPVRVPDRYRRPGARDLRRRGHLGLRLDRREMEAGDRARRRPRDLLRAGLRLRAAAADPGA